MALVLAGCSGAEQAALPRQPSLRVADAALTAGAPDVAMRVAEMNLARDPHNSRALVAKGDALYAMGERDAARAAYREALALDPKLGSAQLGLGRTLVQSDPAAAEAAFLAAIVALPDNSAALNDLGIARDLQGRHAEAQDAYRKALAIAPEAADLKVNLGLSLALTGDKDAAVAVLREAAAQPAVVQDRTKELAAALVLAGDDASARRVLSTNSAQAAPGGIAVADAPPPPVAASHEASAAAGPRQARQVRELAAAPPPAPQPDPPSIPLAIAPAPVVAVTRTGLVSSPDTAPEALVDTAALRPPPPAITRPAPAVTASPLRRVPASSSPEKGAFVQLASLHSLDDAWYEWRRLNRRFPELLDGHAPVIIQAGALGETYWCLRTFGFADLAEANAMCASAHGASGLRCWARSAS
jgi:Flp pilus assembly protein TadD